MSRSDQPAGNLCASWGRSGSQSTRKPGFGTIMLSERGAARSSILGGKPKQAVFSLHPFLVPQISSRDLPHAHSLAFNRRFRAMAIFSTVRVKVVLLDSWPGQMRTVYGDHKRFVETYFANYPGKYFAGDGCRRDEDGYYWITGRVDDVINVSGHRMGTAEVESALVAHDAVSEAAVVGFTHDIKGQGIYAYVTLMAGSVPSEGLKVELVNWVRKEIGPIATPDHIQWAPGLPKTRSGKIMRRILRKIAENDPGNLGDTSTLADPAVVDDLVSNRMSA